MRDRFRSEERRIEVLKTLNKKKAMAKAKNLFVNLVINNNTINGELFK